jgi:alanine dehydrogenase
MIIGIPKEIKNHEYRVGLTPDSAKECIKHGHEILVQTNAGDGIGSSDKDYIAIGAKIIQTAKEVFDLADMIVKVKEPQANEVAMLREGQILFTYLHLAPDPEQTKGLIKSGAICIAYETVTSSVGGLPLLAPMSKVAGRLATQAGAHYLEHAQGGLGALLGGVAGVAPRKVVIIGAGVVGTHSASMAVGLGGDVWVIDNNINALEHHWQQFGNSTKTIFSTTTSLTKHIKDADLVIGGVLIPGASAPKLVSEDMIKGMKKGSVLVDVAIDQGGCFATSKVTTHQDPVYTKHGVIHYCVGNMPGSVPLTSTYALNNATLPFVLQLANKGIVNALKENEHLANGLNIYKGKVTCKEVANSLEYNYTPTSNVI